MARTPKYKHQILSDLSRGDDPIKVAERYPVTPSYVYKLGKKLRDEKNSTVIEGKFSVEKSTTTPPSPTRQSSKSTMTAAEVKQRLGIMSRLNSGLSRGGRFAVSPISTRGGGVPSPFSQLSTTSLKRHGGDVAEEYLRELQGTRGTQIYKEMGNDSIVSAVLSAVKMTLRRVTWFADDPPRKKKGKTATDKTETDKSSDGDADKDFLDQCMSDMSLSWSDFIDQALSMIQFGFAPFEVVYKVRRGNIPRPGPKTSKSKYDDGKIGWRKFVFIGQDTLQQGNSWIFDESDGSLRGLNQQPPIGAPLSRLQTIAIPIEKMVLFRTTVERDNPEGRSLLRGVWKSYFYKSQLEEVEAISAERLGAGLPVIYLGDDVAKGDTADSDFAEFQKIVRNIRVDEQMGLLVPFAKMGQGMAREGSGVLVELLSPPARGNVSFGEIIQRYEKRIAMVGLAQFIHLGMDQQGSQALADTTTDFFQLAVSAWADSLQDTINRFLVEPLFRLNGISNEDHPIISHGDVSAPNLADIADYINKTVGAQVITPDDKLEEALRRLAGFPDKDDATARPVMNEQDGDGGQRVGRNEKAKPVNNQRNQNPSAEKPREAEKPQAKKPMRASEDIENTEEL